MFQLEEEKAPCSPVIDQGIAWGGVDEALRSNAEDKRHRSDMIIGLRLPRRPKRPGKHHKHRKHGNKESSVEVDISPTALTPSETVQNLLEEVNDDEHSAHSVFCQLDSLYRLANEMQWRETARWVKYEEDVEEGGERWSKPHVASLSLHSLFELRSNLLAGSVMLEMDAHSITQVADLLLDNLIGGKLLEESLREEVKYCLISQHLHQHLRKRKSVYPGEDPGAHLMRRLSMKRTLSEIGRNLSMSRRVDGSPQLGKKFRGNPISSPCLESLAVNSELTHNDSSTKLNEHFMKKIPHDAETASIWAGELPDLKYQITAFIRLVEGRHIGDVAEVPLPVRFLVVLLGPPGSQTKNIEAGRSMATIMIDEVFREVAYKARTKKELLSGIDEFLDQVTVLPPGEWDPKIRIEPPQSVPSQSGRMTHAPTGPMAAEMNGDDEDEVDSHADPTLRRTGRLFGGLVEDIKRKLPHYPSDFTDSLHLQCVASTIFLFLATLTPNVTFGGLLGQETEGYMATMECILTASIVGILFALFSGQPLNILGSTGPMLVLEMILYQFCADSELDFLPFRAWVGIWTSVLCFLIVMFDLSALVRYITRFTEESFACLIALIFIYEAFKKQFEILTTAGIDPTGQYIYEPNCTCFPPKAANESNSSTTMSTITTTPVNESDWFILSIKECKENEGRLVGPMCEENVHFPDVFFISFLLFLGTFTLAASLSGFKSSTFFPTFVRQTVSDFAVLIAIIIMVGLDIAIGVNTPKLTVPSEFKPTRDDRGWLVNPISDKNPWWLIIVAIVPAILAVILVFMDQQITAVIVNRKENKLEKGSGYHLDMFVLAICILICSLLGLPWYVAATVSAIAHVQSLKKESECTAPGVKPEFLGVREQRVTALCVGILSFLSVFLTTVLKMIPMSVLYGVFLYMGVAALKGMQLIDRIFLMFMPAKYQPDYSYLRHVRIKKIHLFTLIQVFCLALLWTIKSFKEVSIIFPIMVLGMIFVRKGMNCAFSQKELKWLDDIMPDSKKKGKSNQDEHEHDEGEQLLDDDEEKARDVKLEKLKQFNKFDPSMRRGSVDTCNISQEMCKTGIWLQLKDSQKPMENGNLRNGHSKRRSKEPREPKKKPSFYIEPPEDDTGNGVSDTIPEERRDSESNI